ncbi:MAG TPA: WbqC family protein [Flavobacterium sp.]|nr:WbqC family protein [Flavobacterium sp.]
MKILIHPTYFPSVSHFAAMIQADEICFEMEDNFQKQTNRNRMYIYSPNGKQLLNIPVKHTKGTHQKFKDIELDTHADWQKQHFKSLEAAYRSSPYFEFFEDEFRQPIFEKKHRFMMDLNLQIHEILCDCLQIELPFSQSNEYHKIVTDDVTDLRYLADGKKEQNEFESYTQVFEDKHGFINNLSTLDLLFNEGLHSVDYLKRQIIKI